MLWKSCRKGRLVVVFGRVTSLYSEVWTDKTGNI